MCQLENAVAGVSVHVLMSVGKSYVDVNNGH